MGGNALKTHFGIEVKRVSTEEFYSIVNEAKTILAHNGFYGESVEFYKNKASHGDIDMVVAFKDHGPTVVEVKAMMRTDIVYKNHNCFSCLFQGTQLDLIFVPTTDFIPNLNFRDYSPFGNIFSRLLKQLDVSWKLDGLYYILRIGDSYAKSIPLTGDFGKILQYGGLCYDSYTNYGRGFEKEEDIFHYVTTSKYFRKSIYAFENLNHVNRKRDTVRPDYNRWNKYIENVEDKLLPEQIPTEEENLEKVARYFPHALPKIKKGYDEYIKYLKIREKFNGDWISLHTGLKGKGLGDAMARFKNELGNLFDFFILGSSKDEILSKFREINNLTK
jgi:hypothetical protein